MSEAQQRNVKFQEQLANLINSAIGNQTSARFIIAELANAEFDLRSSMREVQKQQEAIAVAKSILPASQIPPSLGNGRG